MIPYFGSKLSITFSVNLDRENHWRLFTPSSDPLAEPFNTSCKHHTMKSAMQVTVSKHKRDDFLRELSYDLKSV